MSGPCCGEIWGDAWSRRPRTCGKNGKHEHDGKWWCKLHHPPTVAAKKAEKEAAWKAEREASDAEWKLKKAIAKRKDAIVIAAGAERKG